MVYSEFKSEVVWACLEATKAAFAARDQPPGVRAPLDDDCFAQWTKLMFADYILLAGVREKGESQAWPQDV